MAMTADAKARRPAVASSGLSSYFYRREFRLAIYQILIVLVLGALLWMIVNNTITNLRRQNIASGFGFLGTTAGFDISQTLIEYKPTSTYARALLVGLGNTLLVAVVGIIFATIVGFAVGIARLSSNWLIARLATVYIEILRNIPLLLQLFVWYFAVIKNLPQARETHVLPGGALLNIRGLFLPAPIPQSGFGIVMTLFAIGILATIAVAIWSRRRQRATGAQFPVFLTSLGLILGVPLLAFLALGMPLGFDYPVLRGFNFQGGIEVLPELMAVLFGLVFYTAATIAEIVRAGIQGVHKGQKEAARSLGLNAGQVLRLVVLPQASRIIIPPLTSNYLNLTKNSSLGVAIAYPELVSIFTGTVLNQTGQAIEVIFITMLIYLTLSLVTSMFMNWFNARMALVER